MLLIMKEKFWGINRAKAKNTVRTTGICIRWCRVRKLPKIGRNDSYNFAVTEVGKGTAVVELQSGKKAGHKIPLERFKTSTYRTPSCDAGYIFDFYLL